MDSFIFRRENVWFIVCVLLLGVCSTPSYAETIFLCHDEIQDSMVEGIRIEDVGDYSVWVWSKDSEAITVHLRGERFKAIPNENSTEAFSWKKLGVFHADETGRISFRIVSDENRQILKPNIVGWFALSFNPNWNPEDYFSLTKVFPNSTQTVEDERVEIVRSNQHYYPFPEYDSIWKWLQRKRDLHDHILVSMGAYPFPDKCALNAKIFDRIEHEDYTIEKVYFESYPGFFVTGNLYRPNGKIGPFPGVVSPHGHWSEGRLANEERGSVPGRAINLARQGYVVFTYDMVGYVDSKQVDHQFGGPAEWLWGISLHGLQFWNSIRAVDFLCSLDDVDADRIGCTGASGGGTQTFCLMAVDKRVKVAAPVNMISAHFQGGCLCENAPNLRIDADNVEFGAMMAPRPLLMVSATGDWTFETPRIEFPAVRSIYRLFDAEGKVHSVQVDAPHNYNKQSREAVYAWFGKWLLGIEDAEKLREQPFEVEKDENLRVFPDSLPENAVNEEQLVSYLKEESEKQLQEVFPADERALRSLRRRAGTALQHVLGAEQPSRNELDIQRIGIHKLEGLTVEQVIIGRKEADDQIPGVLLIPNNWNQSQCGTLIVHEKGKVKLIDTDTGKPSEFVQTILDGGQLLFMPDVFLVGEFHSPFSKTVRDTDTSHFLTYNRTTMAVRIQDILTAAAYLDSRSEAKRINLIGLGQAGIWSLLAAAIMEPLNSVIIDTYGFDGEQDSLYLEDLFVPGLRRAGDVRTAQALLAPTPVILFNTQGKFDTKWAVQAYQTARASDLLEVLEGPIGSEMIAAWLRDMKIY